MNKLVSEISEAAIVDNDLVTKSENLIYPKYSQKSLIIIRHQRTP